MEKSAALTFLRRREKFSCLYEKGGINYVRFSGTAFCIIDFVGTAEVPDRETERRAQEKSKEEITRFKMERMKTSALIFSARKRPLFYLY